MASTDIERELLAALEAAAPEHGIDVVDVEVVGASKASGSSFSSSGRLCYSGLSPSSLKTPFVTSHAAPAIQISFPI